MGIPARASKISCGISDHGIVRVISLAAERLHFSRRSWSRFVTVRPHQATFFSCPKPIPPFSSLHRCILHHIFLTSCQSTFNHPHDYLNLKRRHNNTFSHHPAPAQCTPSHLRNLLSSHVKHTILYSFV